MKPFEEINGDELGAVVSRWTGNDNSARFNTCVVSITKTRDLVLRWRKSKDHHPVLVGYFRMYPEELIKEGYCEEVDGKIRVNLYHHRDGRITLSLKRHGGKAIAVGKVILN